ncbi:ABC transporter ATP-binding protein [Actinoplanes sp. NPDC026623]|uniref:ABC transporter ATP-binding protein n=1 Tax=Actinoplanes sp. NPDC026623 TaxID=3155610 RepID=UPI0033C4E1FF
MSDDIPAAVTVEGVSRRFGTTDALRDCTLTIPAGAVVAVLGRNGAGKSTLLRAIVGLLRPDRGRLTVLGQPLNPSILPRIGYVAQQAPLYRNLTVQQTLRLGARLNPRWATDYAEHLVHTATLPTTARVGSLSAGQRTRLALAMALGKRPDLLILDEPLAALDPIARTEVIGTLMAEVADRGVTIVLSAHVVADIQHICDRVVVLAAGGIRLDAETDAAVAEHRIAVGAVRDLAALDGLPVVELRRDGNDFTALVHGTRTRDAGSVAWHSPTLEEVLLGYLRTAKPQPVEEVRVA